MLGKNQKMNMDQYTGVFRWGLVIDVLEVGIGYQGWKKKYWAFGIGIGIGYWDWGLRIGNWDWDRVEKLGLGIWDWEVSSSDGEDLDI